MQNSRQRIQRRKLHRIRRRRIRGFNFDAYRIQTTMASIFNDIKTIDELRASGQQVGANEGFWKAVRAVYDANRIEYDAIEDLRKICGKAFKMTEQQQAHFEGWARSK